MAVTVSDKDRGFRRLLQETRKLEANPAVKVGVQGADASELKTISTPTGEDTAPITVVEIANFHEFGLGNNPERSFLRATIDEKRSVYFGITRILRDEIIRGRKTVAEALAILGEKIKSDVQQRITEGIPPALSSMTLEHKTVNGRVGDVPLIDTGQLRQSITYVVEERPTE